MFEEMFEIIEVRLCLRHFYVNFKKKFGEGTLIWDLPKRAAKAAYYQVYSMEEKNNWVKENWP